MLKSEVQVQRLINQLVKLIEDTKVNEKIKLKKADYLLRLGARVDFDLFVKVDGIHKPLVTAIDDIPLLTRMIDAGANINQLGGYEFTPLTDAVFYNKYEKAKVLLRKGANPNAGIEKSGFSSLMYAIFLDKKEMFNLMLDSKMDIEAKNGVGWTALFYAVDQNRKEYARELILRGANIDVIDLRTGLGLLEYPCNEETKKVVIEAIKERDLKKNNNVKIIDNRKYNFFSRQL